MTSDAVPETTEDLVYGGAVTVRQPARGYRVNVDTLLLAAAFDPDKSWAGCSFVELGCGVGAALIAIARTHAAKDPPIRLVGVEQDAAIAALARENAERNAAAHQIDILAVDALTMEWPYGSFDRVLFNPPFDYPGEGRAPAPERAGAHVAARPIGDWIRIWSNRLTGEGHMTLIHRAHRLGEILAAMEGRLGGVEIVPVRPAAEAPARRIIVRARKGSKAPLQLHRGLDLHPSPASNDKYTPEADALLRGERWIGFC